MTGVINTGSFAKALRPGLKKIWGIAYNEHKTVFDRVYTKESSDKSYEERLGFVGTGLARKKDQGSGIFFDSMQQGFVSRLTNVAYSLGFIITREMRDDNQYMQLAATWTKALARSFRITKEINAANVFNRAFNSSYATADGQALCSTAHLTKAGLTFSNRLSTDADLSYTAVQQALIQLQGFTDERGLPMHLQGKCLHVPRQLMFEANTIMYSTGRPGSANNDNNALKDMSMLPDGCVWSPYLTDTDAWFIVTDCPEGMIYQERVAAEFDSEPDFNTHNAKFGAYERYVFGPVDVRGVIGSAGT